MKLIEINMDLVGKQPIHYDPTADCLIVEGNEISPEFLVMMVKMCKAGQKFQGGWDDKANCATLTNID